MYNMQISKTDAWKKIYADPKYDLWFSTFPKTQHGNEDMCALRDAVLDNLPDYVEIEKANREFEKQYNKRSWMANDLWKADMKSMKQIKEELKK